MKFCKTDSQTDTAYLLIKTEDSVLQLGPAISPVSIRRKLGWLSRLESESTDGQTADTELGQERHEGCRERLQDPSGTPAVTTSPDLASSHRVNVSDYRKYR